jgi:hypothetical protein
MNRSAKIILLFLASLLLAHPYVANAAEKKNLNKFIKLVREASTDSAKPSYHLSYMGMDFTTYITLRDGKPKKVEVVYQTFYGAKEDFKTYTLGDDNLDGVVDYATYKQGDKIKGTFDKDTETGKDIRTDAQSLYDSDIYFTLKKLGKE